MLISFSVANYRSFGEEETLNMVASKKLTEHPSHLVPIGATGKSMVRAAVIYGANAAGKSNLVRAMSYAAQSIVNGPMRFFGTAEPFRFDRVLADKPTSFEFRFLAQEQIFVYGFDVKRHNIVGEWLARVDGNDEGVIFERDEHGNARVGEYVDTILVDDPQSSSTLKVLAKLPLTTDQLFLNRAMELPDEAQGRTLRSVIRWLTRELVVLRPEPIDPQILNRLATDSDFRLFAEGFLRSVGTGVSSLQVIEKERDADDFELQVVKRYQGDHARPIRPLRAKGDTEVLPKPDDPSHVITRTLFADHSGCDDDSRLRFSEESDGTKQLLHLMPVLSTLTDDARVVVIDELDRSLHPLICWEFIRFFSETAPGAHKQLIVTTHEAHLLNQDLLRRDEYWFVEKDQAHQSRLVSLSDFKIRNDLQVEKGYLQGRFGAIPVIGTMDDLEALLQKPKNAESDDAPQTSST